MGVKSNSSTAISFRVLFTRFANGVQEYELQETSSVVQHSSLGPMAPETSPEPIMIPSSMPRVVGKVPVVNFPMASQLMTPELPLKRTLLTVTPEPSRTLRTRESAVQPVGSWVPGVITSCALAKNGSNAATKVSN